MATTQIISAEYYDGISEGRAIFKSEGMELAAERLDNLNSTCRQFAASGPVGQFLRGERDFWAHQIKKAGKA